MLRTSQVPLAARRRTRFQPRPEGAIKTGSDAGSILKFLPTNHLGRRAFPNNHLDCSCHVAGFTHANDAHNRVIESDQAGKLRKLLRCESERKPNLIERFEVRIVLCAVDPIRAAPQLQKAIDDLFVEAREGKQDIARSPDKIDRPGAVEGEIRVPIAARW